MFSADLHFQSGSQIGFPASNMFYTNLLSTLIGIFFKTNFSPGIWASRLHAKKLKQRFLQRPSKGQICKTQFMYLC